MTAIFLVTSRQASQLGLQIGSSKVMLVHSNEHGLRDEDVDLVLDAQSQLSKSTRKGLPHPPELHVVAVRRLEPCTIYRLRLFTRNQTTFRRETLLFETFIITGNNCSFFIIPLKCNGAILLRPGCYGA